MSARVDLGRTRLTAADVDLLRQVAAGAVTYRSEGWSRGPRTSYRLWSSETEYVIVTPRAKRLYDRGLLSLWSNYGRQNHGPVELTDAGRAALNLAGGA